MKVRKLKRQYAWLVRPHSDKYKNKVCKTKKEALKYLKSMGYDALNSYLDRDVKGINYSHTSYRLFVWFNQYDYENKKAPFKLELKHELFRGSKYIFKERYLEKSTVKYFTKSEQIINLMCYIANEYETGRKPTDSNLKNIIKLFIYRFGEIPNNADGYGDGINNIEDCEWWYWSDRCGYNRASVIIRCIKNEKPYLFNGFEKAEKAQEKNI